MDESMRLASSVGCAGADFLSVGCFAGSFLTLSFAVPVLRGLSTNTPEITRRISNALFTNTMRVVKYLLFIFLRFGGRFNGERNQKVLTKL
jgi:hypothetical protein